MAPLKMIKALIVSIAFLLPCFSYCYPTHWWKEVPADQLKSWEISPHTATEDYSVVLSKRNELGILSNFAHTPFTINGHNYESVEGLWQSMKYPENPQDERFPLAPWPHSRQNVEQMVGSKAKKAGSFASKVMKDHDINWVTYQGEKLVYRTSEKGPHYQLVKQILWQKLMQNPKVKDVLMRTGSLILLPDHKTKSNDPPAWKYFDIWMEIREQLKTK